MLNPNPHLPMRLGRARKRDRRQTGSHHPMQDPPHLEGGARRTMNPPVTPQMTLPTGGVHLGLHPAQSAGTPCHGM